MPRILHTNLNTFAFSVACWPGGMVVLGRHARHLSPIELRAVIAHEEGHLSLRHARTRLWWLVTARWATPGLLSQGCRDQEVEADDYAIRQGHGLGLFKFIARFPESHNSPLHPTKQERLDFIQSRMYPLGQGADHGK